MGSVISGPDYSRITEKGLLGIFLREHEQLLDAGWADMVGFRSMSNQETETYVDLGMTPAMREWIGSRKAQGLRVEEFSLTNKLYEDTLAVAVDDLRLDKLGVLERRIGNFAQRASEHWEKLLTTLITSNGTCYDSQSYFSTSHSSGSSGTQDNALVAGTLAALNVTTAASPTREEMIDIILGMVAQVYGFKDDVGEPLNGGARSFIIMVPTNMMASALGAVNDSFTVSGGSNTLRENLLVNVRPVVNPRLTSTTELYCFRSDANAKPFVLQSQQDVTTSIIGAGSEEEFKNRRWLFGLEAKRNVGYASWSSAVKGTTS